MKTNLPITAINQAIVRLRQTRFNALTVGLLLAAALVVVRVSVPKPAEKPFWPDPEDYGFDTISVNADYAELSEGDETRADTRKTVAKLISGKIPYNDLFYKANGEPNYYAWTIYDCKRREAQGKKGQEYARYIDGYDKLGRPQWAIGYGNHIKYMSKSWQRTIKAQGNKINESQARAIMVETFNSLVEQVKRDYPLLHRNQQLAIASISFNWGYGKFKRSKVSKYIKDGVLTSSERDYWINKTQSQTPNHRTSRAFEAALFMAHANDTQKNTALNMAKSAWRQLQKRGDFTRYD